MIRLLEKALAAVDKLPAAAQDTVAAWLLDVLASEQQWDSLFDRSGAELDRLAAEALAEHRGGDTKILTPDTL